MRWSGTTVSAPTGVANEYELSQFVTFPGTNPAAAEGKKEQWVVTLQLGARQLDVEYELGLRGTVHYLLHVASGPLPHYMVVVLPVCTVVIGLAVAGGVLLRRVFNLRLHREHQD